MRRETAHFNCQLSTFIQSDPPALRGDLNYYINHYGVVLKPYSSSAIFFTLSKVLAVAAVIFF